MSNYVMVTGQGQRQAFSCRTEHSEFWPHFVLTHLLPEATTKENSTCQALRPTLATTMSSRLALVLMALFLVSRASASLTKTCGFSGETTYGCYFKKCWKICDDDGNYCNLSRFYFSGMGCQECSTDSDCGTAACFGSCCNDCKVRSLAVQASV